METIRTIRSRASLILETPATLRGRTSLLFSPDQKQNNQNNNAENSATPNHPMDDDDKIAMHNVLKSKALCLEKDYQLEVAEGKKAFVRACEKWGETAKRHREENICYGSEDVGQCLQSDGGIEYASIRRRFPQFIVGKPVDPTSNSTQATPVEADDDETIVAKSSHPSSTEDTLPASRPISLSPIKINNVEGTRTPRRKIFGRLIRFGGLAPLFKSRKK